MKYKCECGCEDYHVIERRDAHVMQNVISVLASTIVMIGLIIFIDGGLIVFPTLVVLVCGIALNIYLTIIPLCNNVSDKITLEVRCLGCGKSKFIEQQDVNSKNEHHV